MNDKTPIDFSPRWPEIPADEDEGLKQLRLDIRASYEETWELMRNLHADLVAHLDRLTGNR